MDKFISLRIGEDDEVALESVKEHYQNVLKIPLNTNLLYRMAMKKLAEQIKNDTNRGQ